MDKYNNRPIKRNKDKQKHAAAYDENDTVTGCDRAELDSSGSASVTLNKTDDAASVKIFVWTDDMQPLTTVYTEQP